MKVSIITLHSSINYGSVLQTYATQKIFENLDCEVEFIDYCRPNNTEDAQIEKTYKAKSIQIVDKLSFGILRPVLRKIVTKRVRRRAVPMKDFLHRRVTLTPDSYKSFEDIQKNTPNADVYVTGSDQVWNSKWNGGVDLCYYLEFAPEGKRRIAYAASIGQSEISDEEKQTTKKYLKKYHRISVREASAVDILSNMGIVSKLVLDPTLMLDKSEWLSISKKPESSTPYLLMYQLNASKKMDDYAVKIARKYGLRVIKICKNPVMITKKGGIEYLSLPSVEELIGYFENASLVLTDSFHGTAFSINLEKEFVSVMPPRFGTRISSLLEMTGAEQRLLEDYSDLGIYERKIDWDHIRQVLTEKREESYGFLREAFK